MSRRFPRILPFLPAAGWYAVIFCLSAQTGTHSSALSDSLTLRLLRWSQFFFPGREPNAAVMELATFLVRKSAHMAAYFILTALLLWAFGRAGLSPGRRAGAALLSCALLAGLDEFHQLFVPGRSGQLRDVGIDLIGSACFLLLWAAVHYIRTKTAHTAPQ